MKFLKVRCERRNTLVFINLHKIVLLASPQNDITLIEVEGLSDNKGAVEVHQPAEEIIRMINGEDKAAIGFRAAR
jgi:hypothetical protein